MTEPKWVDIPKNIRIDEPDVVSGRVRLAEVQQAVGESSCRRCVYHHRVGADVSCPSTTNDILFCARVEFLRRANMFGTSYIFLDAAPQTIATAFPRGKSLRASLRRPP